MQIPDLFVILGILLTAGILTGHVAITVTTLNVTYGQGWIARKVLRSVRLLHDMVLFLGTPLLAWVCFRAGCFTQFDTTQLPPAALIYFAFAALVGWIVVPMVLLRRWTRRLPEAQLSNHGHTIDVADRLGHRPIGSGPKRLMAYWPGNEQFQLEVLERTYQLPRLRPELDGLSILHLSDLHFTGTVGIEYFEEVFEEAGKLECDIVAVTGDLVDQHSCYEWVTRLLGKLHGRLASYAILGNHDSWYDHERIRRDLVHVGYRVLSGRWEILPVAEQSLVVAGTESPWMGGLPDLSAAPPDAFRLLLSHTPDNAPWASRIGFDLMLAGHNHGGQVRLPLIGPVFMPSRFGCRFDMGAFQIGPTLIHVSRGISGKHPFRWRCRPELTKLVLRAVADGAVSVPT